MLGIDRVVAYWPMTSWPVTFVACSGGFVNILYSFGLGYGLSMTANAALTAAVTKHQHRRLTPFGLVCCGLYAAYGVRLTHFLLRRQGEESYKNRFDVLQLKSDMMGISSKLAIVMGVSFSQALYALPLAVAMSPAPTKARPALRAAGWAGVGLAALGLAIEAWADEHKLEAKRRAPKLPVMDGLYSYCRHPNYLGEFIFHCGISCMGLCGTPIQVAACVFPTFFMAFTLHNSAARSDKEADHRYKNCDGYAQWVESTPILFPGAKRDAVKLTS